MRVHEMVFRELHNGGNGGSTRVRGLRITCPEGEQHLLGLIVRIWVDPGGESAVEASANTWNRGLDPLLTCPDRCEVVVSVRRSLVPVDVQLLYG